MESIAADLSQRLAACAEAVCHHYLPNGVRRGSYWIVGDVSGAKGRSLYVRLRSSSSAAAGNWTDAESGQHGDLLDLIRLNRGLPTLREAFEEARMFLNEPPQARRGTCVSTAETSDRRKPSEAAARLFALTSPIPGTTAETYLRGRPYAEVASELGVPEGTIKSRVYYGLRALRNALEEMGYDG